MKILAIDPGGTTGLAWYNFHGYDFYDTRPGTAMPRGFGPAAVQIDMLIAQFDPDLIVVEKFTINASTIQKSREGSNLAIELVGVTRFLAKQSGKPLEEQSPADAKNFVTDEKLRRIGWYVAGPDHARDALRHVLLASVRHGVVNPAVFIGS